MEKGDDILAREKVYNMILCSSKMHQESSKMNWQSSKVQKRPGTQTGRVALKGWVGGGKMTNALKKVIIFRPSKIFMPNFYCHIRIGGRGKND